MDKDFRFCVSGSSLHGLGHVRRCLTLARCLVGKGVPKNRIEFIGELDQVAKKVLSQSEFSECWHGRSPSGKAAVAVIDRMFDTMDAEYYDPDLIKELTQEARNRILICSSNTIPTQLPIDLAVGYLLENNGNQKFEVLTGLEFSPVESKVLEYRVRRRAIHNKINRCVVAFGNWLDPTATFNCLSGLDRSGFKGRVDLVVCKAQEEFKSQFEKAARNLNISFFSSVPNIHSMLAESDLLLGSYGLLTYEAMTIGVPTMVIPLKEFMASYGRHLMKRNLCYLVSGRINASVEDVIKGISVMTPMDIREKLRNHCDRLFDGRGLNRLADVIVRRLEK
jgi:spore coat polysaccharide biosynthesis predicted glycosyltransferase SpsG